MTLTESVRIIDAVISGGRRGEHACVSATTAVRAVEDDLYRAVISRCALVTADGQGVVWASRILGSPVPERVAGIDLMLALLSLAEDRDYGVYLLGAQEDVLADATAEIVRRHPTLRIVGQHHGYFSADEDESVVAEIAASGAQLLFVAMPTPRKEYFVDGYRERLNVAFAVGVGGTFDILAGRFRRAPRWMQHCALEWAFRVAQEPRRLARRFLLGNTRFVYLVLRGCGDTMRARRSSPPL